uniref:InlA n=1 Tax=Listeria monocytogenes TaxID=1639 RepID=B1NPN9_LISMN|nr:truncated internalin A [Listeria monocytogenes]ABV54214.1 truncated internalin A [Listeria monocytogenes]ABV54215.1 truncated internalin A [Listeria monocytogenes]ABV54216.1 truncated internalin A [Listeria monocytogenes]ABV54217.1 truncated internalin A [Listeria monocytogenes]
MRKKTICMVEKYTSSNISIWQWSMD